MKVRIKFATRVSGQHLAEGKVLNVPDEDGYILLAANKAERIIDTPGQELELGTESAVGEDGGELSRPPSAEVNPVEMLMTSVRD